MSRKFIRNHLASDTRSRAGVRRSPVAERVRTVDLGGLRRQKRIKAFVAAWSWQARGSNAGDAVRVEFPGVEAEAVRQAFRVLSTNLDRQATLDFSARVAPRAAFETNGSASSSPRTTAGSTGQVGILSSANERTRVSAWIALCRTLTARIWPLGTEFTRIASSNRLRARATGRLRHLSTVWG